MLIRNIFPVYHILITSVLGDGVNSAWNVENSFHTAKADNPNKYSFPWNWGKDSWLWPLYQGWTIFQKKYTSNLKNLGARRMKRNKSHTEGPQMLGVTERPNAQDLCNPALYICVCVWGGGYCRVTASRGFDSETVQCTLYCVPKMIHPLPAGRHYRDLRNMLFTI